MLHLSQPFGFQIRRNLAMTFDKSEAGSLGLLLSRVVDLALNQAAKPWFHQYLHPAWYHLWLCFRTCIGDKSATLLRVGGLL